MIHQGDDGTCVAASGGVWIPGCFEDQRTARYAFRFTDAVLQRLQDRKNAEQPDGTGGVITFTDLQAESRKR